MKQLHDLFCSECISAEQFVERLDQLAWMLETEEQ